MSKLHFYINGTDGGTDGVEITQLTFKNMKKYMITYLHDGGQYPLSYIFLSLRFEKGYKGSVTVSKKMSDTNYQTLSGAFTTKYPTSRIDTYYISGTDTITGQVTDVNATLLLVLKGTTYESDMYSGVDIPLQDILSFSFIEEKA